MPLLDPTKKETSVTRAAAQAREAAAVQLAAKRDELLDKVFAGTPLTPAERAEWAQLRAAARKP